MIIRERDFKIESDGSCFALYFLKTKKELKDDEKASTEAVDSFKVKGYYTTLPNAIRAAFRWRAEEKYPFKEFPFREDYIRYRKALEKLDHQSRLIYESIIELKLKTYAEHREFLSRIQE
jgi:hypothetical protein